MIVSLLCELVVQGVIVAVDHYRNKRGLWRCPECGKSHAPDRTHEPKKKRRKREGKADE